MINKIRLIEEFLRLSAIDAHSFQERKKADYIIERLNELCFKVEEDQAGSFYGGNAGNLYAYKKGEIEGPPILFSAHLDTVAPGEGIKVMQTQEGMLVSDGTTILGADDNSGLSAILEALQSIHESQEKHRDLELLFTIGEEAYLKGSQVFDYSNIRAKQAYVLDLSGKVGTAAIAAPSVLSFTVSVTGKASHAGFAPEEGIHAIEIVADIISKIQQGRLDEETTLNIGFIEGGTGTNIVPASCVFKGEVRSLNHEKAEKLLEQVEKKIKTETQRKGASYKMETSVGCKAYRVDEKSEVIQSFERACRKVEISPNMMTTLGGSDNNNFAQHGIEGIVLACAMEQVHSCQEYAEIAELEKITQITYELMKSVTAK